MDLLWGKDSVEAKGNLVRGRIGRNEVRLGGAVRVTVGGKRSGEVRVGVGRVVDGSGKLLGTGGGLVSCGQAGRVYQSETGAAHHARSPG
jgi:hypothetical protein